MKTFIYTTKSKPRRMGGSNVTAKVFRIKNNTPECITTLNWCTASFKGEESAIMNHLAEEKDIPKKYSGYYSERDQDIFRIISVD